VARKTYLVGPGLADHHLNPGTMSMLRRVVATLALVASTLNWSCFKARSGGPGEIEVDGFHLQQIEIENPRFELRDLPATTPAIQPALSYWVRTGDKVASLWSTFEEHWQGADGACSFVDNVGTPNCKVCDVCANTSGGFCLPTGQAFLPNFVSVVVEPGFAIGDGAPVALGYPNLATIQSSCAGAGAPTSTAVIFTPQTSGLYRIKGGEGWIRINGATNGESRIHVISTPEKVAYPLVRERVGTTDVWIWAVGGIEYWNENFSPNLHISRVRIAKGTCADGSAFGRQCVVPADAVTVKPSRVLFLLNAEDIDSPRRAQRVCYSHPTATDEAFVDLSRCRPRADTMTGAEVQRSAVPSFEYGSGTGTAFERAIWEVEFNHTDPGAEADSDLSTPAFDPMAPGERLMIEFTIEAN